jgi:hypothetical protein
VRPDDGEVLAGNGNNGFLVVIRSGGGKLAKALIVRQGKPPGSGALFGLALSPNGLYFVDDDAHTLKLISTVSK